MELEVGQTVVHPQHGTVVVEGFEDRDVGGTTYHYVLLRREEDHLTLKVPRSAMEDVGVRSVVGVQAAEAALAVLETTAELPDNWRQLRARNERKLQTGGITELAEVVRDLRTRHADKPLSLTDRRLLTEARQRLREELSIALGEQERDIKERIDAALADVDELAD